MATIQMKRGVFETLASGLSSTGLAANDFRIPVDAIGARIAFEYIWSAGVSAGVADIQSTLDGTNWQNGAGSAGVTAGSLLDSCSFIANTNVIHVLLLQRVLGIRVNLHHRHRRHGKRVSAGMLKFR